MSFLHPQTSMGFWKREFDKRALSARAILGSAVKNRAYGARGPHRKRG